jgi:hypothetical protein
MPTVSVTVRFWPPSCISILAEYRSCGSRSLPAMAEVHCCQEDCRLELIRLSCNWDWETGQGQLLAVSWEAACTAKAASNSTSTESVDTVEYSK